jgi:hypothetical protein
VYIPLFPSCQKAPLSIALLDPRQQTTGSFFFLALFEVGTSPEEICGGGEAGEAYFS